MTHVLPELDFYFYTENWQKGGKKEIVHQSLGNLLSLFYNFLCSLERTIILHGE